MLFVVDRFCVVQSHAEGRRDAPDTAAQEGLVPFVQRCFILHASKLLGLAVFWAAMQQPGAIGWLLTCNAPAAHALLQAAPAKCHADVHAPLYVSNLLGLLLSALYKQQHHSCC